MLVPLESRLERISPAAKAASAQAGFARIEDKNKRSRHHNACDQTPLARTKKVFRMEHFFDPICRRKTSW